jgi:hypothetical protein
MLRLDIDGRWEPEDFIEVLKGLESLYYKATLGGRLFVDYPFYRYEWARFSGSFQEQLDSGNDWLLDWARTTAPSEFRLRLTRIEYASPGGIDLVGLGEACKAIERIVSSLIKFFAERPIRRERAAQARIQTARMEAALDRDHESLRSLKIQNARDLLSLRRDFPDVPEDYFLSLATRDQDKLIPRIAERKLIAATTVEDGDPPQPARRRR